jgi:hypothetical protein
MSTRNPAHQRVLPMEARLTNIELSRILSLHLKADGRVKTEI